ncbi:MAG: hypothetical protein LBU65_09170 [Planctomycetaceae bacterium]|jgi:hypothetical protein|nr:hypothetical protein [Planctomycetaceae bacterium]
MCLTSSDKNKIFINCLDKPAVISDVLLHIHNAFTVKNYDSIVIIFPEKYNSISPNIAVPLTGILEYYKTERHINFQLENESKILTRTHLLSPKQYKEDPYDYSSVLNTVWKFETSNEVNGLVRSVVQ